MKMGVVGAGAWGTALAQVLAADGDPVLLWAHEAETIEAINRDHENRLFLPGVALGDGVRAVADLAALGDCEALLVVTPSQHVRNVLSRFDVGNRPLVLCAKGIESKTEYLISETVSDAHPEAPVAVLSGPSFAGEVARGLPTALTLACADLALAERLARRIARPTFRLYLSDDVIGAEIGGAVKNVLAIGCGVVDGAGLGQNARAALISRGFAEMTRYGLARGGRAETLAGLSGLGDLVLTCSSASSRNFSLGRGLGEGGDAKTLLADRRTVAEGAFTAPVLLQSARRLGVDMPVVEAVCALLAGSVVVDQVIGALLARPLRSE